MIGVEEILQEIERRRTAYRRLLPKSAGGPYEAALQDLAGWIESEVDQQRRETTRRKEKHR